MNKSAAIAVLLCLSSLPTAVEAAGRRAYLFLPDGCYAPANPDLPRDHGESSYGPLLCACYFKANGARVCQNPEGAYIDIPVNADRAPCPGYQLWCESMMLPEARP